MNDAAAPLAIVPAVKTPFWYFEIWHPRVNPANTTCFIHSMWRLQVKNAKTIQNVHYNVILSLSCTCSLALLHWRIFKTRVLHIRLWFFTICYETKPQKEILTMPSDSAEHFTLS